MLIVLEGVDGSGKSTLAHDLAGILGADIIHCTKDTPNDWDYFSAIIRMSEDKHIIADRFCYGQFVYQDEADRHLTEHELRGLEMKMHEAGARVVYVYAPEKIIQARLDARDEIPMRPLKELLAGYEKVWEKSLLPITRVASVPR